MSISWNVRVCQKIFLACQFRDQQFTLHNVNLSIASDDLYMINATSEPAVGESLVLHAIYISSHFFVLYKPPGMK